MSLDGEFDDAFCRAITGQITRAVDLCDGDIQSDLWRNIVFAGEEVLSLPCEGLLNLLKADQPERKIIALPSDDQHIAAWKAASCICSLSTYCSMWIDAMDYSNAGPKIVHCKC